MNPKYYTLDPSEPLDHMFGAGCNYGRPDGPDDINTECECPEGWFEQEIPYGKEVCRSCGQLYNYHCDCSDEGMPWYERQRNIRGK